MFLVPKTSYLVIVTDYYTACSSLCACLVVAPTKCILSVRSWVYDKRIVFIVALVGSGFEVLDSFIPRLSSPSSEYE